MATLEQIIASVYGPTSSADNQMVRCDGTSGHKLQVCPDMYCDDNGNLGIGDAAPETLLEITGSVPYITFHCDTESDADESGMSILWFSREQSGGEETHCAAIKAFHDGASDDQKGALAFFTNDGSDDDAPTERMRIDSTGKIIIGTSLELYDPTAVPNERYVRLANFSGETRIMLINDSGTTKNDVALVIDNTDGNIGMGADPRCRLEVYRDIGAPSDLGNYDNYQLLIRGGVDTGDTAGMLFATSTNTYGGSAIVHYDTGGGGQGDLVFYTKQSTDPEPPIEVMRLTDDGYVGVLTKIGVGFNDPVGTMHAQSTGGAASLVCERTDGVWCEMLSGSSAGIFGFENAGKFSIAEAGVATQPGGNWSGTNILTIAGGLRHVGIGEYSPETLLELTSTAPYITFHCDTESDADESGMSILWFSREQSGGEETHCAAIKAFHDGTSDDQKGALAFFTNDGSDDDAPTERMRIDSSGYVGINEQSPDAILHITNYAASDIGQVIELAATPTGNAFEVNTNGASGGDLVKITPGGKIQTTSGFRAVAKEFSDAFVCWEYGGDTAEHSGQTGSYDHTGGTYEKLFTATAAVFSQDDADNHNWIVINSGTYKGAKAIIETYIDTTNVVVCGMGWDGDISSSTFSIVPHPLVICGDGKHVAFGTGSEGCFGIHSKEFAGAGESDSIFRFLADFGTDEKEGLCLDVTANGYNHIDAMHIGFSTGDLQPGDYCHGIHFSVDDTEATSSDSTTEIDCLSFETTDSSSMEHHAIHVGVGFDSALLVSGASAEDPDYGYEVASGVVVDRVNSGGAGDDAFVNAAVDQQIFDADNDYILIGDDDTFEVVGCVLATPGNQNAELEFYYSKAGGNWAQFYPSDNTAGFTKSGNISFSAPGDWTKDDEAEVNGDITNAYYIKIVRTRNNLVTPPTEDYFKIYASLEAGMEIRGDGTIKPASLADANASNESIYYSTDQSKLVYKDSGGTVNDLY